MIFLFGLILQLPAPPMMGSVQYAEDFRVLHFFQDTRTDQECKSADAQSRFSVEKIFGPSSGVLTKNEFDQVRALGIYVAANTAIASAVFKSKYKKPRPFVSDPTLNPCIKSPSEGSYAYPSGHSATAMAIAIVFAKKFPHKAQAILKAGFDVGLNRVLGGVHHPSDVDAGRALARQVVEQLL